MSDGKTKVKSSDPLACVGAAIEDSVAWVLGKWGRVVAGAPALVFLVFFIVAAALAGGIPLGSSETETANLWTPIGAPVLADRDLYEEFFGSGFRTQTVYIKTQTDGGNVISPAVLAAVKDLDTKIRDGTVFVVEDSVTYGYEDLCERNREDEPCLERFNPANYINANTSSLMEPVPAAVQLMFANAKFSTGGELAEASTIKLTYLLSRVNDTNRNSGDDCKKGCNPTLQWEDELVAWLEEYDDKSEDIRIFVQAQNSISNVLSGIIGGDIIALNIAFALIVTYSLLVLGKFHPVFSRSGIAFVGVACVGAAIACTYGLAGYASIPQTPVTALLPFILVGIGVDDMFVLVGALDRAPPYLPTAGRIEYMMRDAGVSITMTSLTDMLAFALGTLTTFPALRYFCIYAAIGIAFDWMFQVTLFVAAIVWDEQRQAVLGVDCFCLVAPCASKEDGECKRWYVKDENRDKTCCGGACCVKEGGYLRAFIKSVYAPLLTLPWVKLAVMLLTIAFFVTGMVGIARIKEDFSLRYFVPSDDPLQEVFAIADAEYKTGETVVNILLDHRYDAAANPYMHASSIPAEVGRVVGGIEGFEWYEDSTVVSPLDVFQLWLPSVNATYPTDTKQFYDLLHQWLATDEGGKFSGMIAVYDWYLGFMAWLETNMATINATETGATSSFGGGDWKLTDFDPATLRPINSTDFCRLLSYYLDTPGASTGAAPVPALGGAADCYPASGDVAMHRVSAAMKCSLDGSACPDSNATAAIAIMDGVRKAMADLESPLKPTAYSFEFLFSEQFKVVREEVFVNLGLALAAVGAVTFLLIGHIFAGFLVVLNVCLVLVDIIGLMWLWNVTLNSVSLINLVLAIGLAVDYSAHVAYAFMRAVGSRDERVVTALGEMGSDVAHGAISTFVAVLITAGAKSYIFQVFFRQFFGIVLFGMIHGLLILPVMLSIVGPASRAAAAAEEEEEEEESEEDSDEENQRETPRETKKNQVAPGPKEAWKEEEKEGEDDGEESALETVAAGGGKNFGASRSVAGSMPCTPAPASAAMPTSRKLTGNRADHMSIARKRSSLDIIAQDAGTGRTRSSDADSEDKEAGAPIRLPASRTASRTGSRGAAPRVHPGPLQTAPALRNSLGVQSSVGSRVQSRGSSSVRPASSRPLTSSEALTQPLTSSRPQTRAERVVSKPEAVLGLNLMGM